jgi:copper chaperone
MKIQLHVENIKCGGCAGTIRSRLLEDARVSTVTVDIAAGLVEIEASEDIGDELRVHLGRLGYPERGAVAGLRSVSAKARSYVSCAVGRLETADEQP